MQAAILRVKLTHLDEWNSRRVAIAKRYLNGLSEVGVVLPSTPAWADAVWHLFVIQHPQRDRLQTSLTNAQIGSLIHYPVPPHKQRAYSEMGLTDGSYPIAEKMASQVLSLPIGPALSEKHADFVIETVRSSVRSIGNR